MDRIEEDEGGHSPLQTLYNAALRPHLPHKISVHNGVAVRGVVRLLDVTDEFPDYEAALIDAIRTRVNQGDEVVIVGGGLGVSTVVAARNTGKDGHVITYEASRSRSALARKTASLNRVEGNCQVRNAVVGPAIKTAGDVQDVKRISPREIPECDVLVMDCEGAELTILTDMEVTPRAIVVETHGFLDSAEKEVRAQLAELGYEVVERGTEDSERGIFILTAVR